LGHEVKSFAAHQSLMAERKLDIKRRYDLTAEIYDERYTRIQREKYEVVKKYLSKRVARILDLGCGTGMFLEELAERNEIVIGVDSSMKMLDIARKRASGASLVCADADHLPFKDRSFDVVVSVTLLQNVPEPVVTMKEIARVLKPKGIAIVTSLKRKHSPEKLADWASSAGLKPIIAEEISDDEDVICVASF
jgi:ubiquinone/menaquinone biosynthesis C-methylase UbiE